MDRRAILGGEIEELEPHPRKLVFLPAARDAHHPTLRADVASPGEIEFDEQHFADLEEDVRAQEGAAAGDVGGGEPDRLADFLGGVGDQHRHLPIDARELAGVAARRSVHGRSSSARAERTSTETRAPPAASGSLICVRRATSSEAATPLVALERDANR